MQSKAETVDAFFSEVQPERLPALQQIRALCREHLVGWSERMQWGMPGYGPEGRDAVVSFNNQKNYISVYPGKAALDEHRDRLAHASFGGGCVRFTKPDRIDFDAVAAMLRHVRKAHAADG